MVNTNIPQRERSQNNPLNLGTFNTTSLRVLTGSLGPKSQIIPGGYGRETYNHWFQVTLSSDAEIILFKISSALTTGNSSLSPEPSALTSRYSISVYDQNKNPIEGRNLFQADAINPSYKGQVMGAQSNLYNTFVSYTPGRGDGRYSPLKAGNYLICISANRNEAFQYGVGLALEFSTSTDELFFLCEDTSEITFLVTENENEDEDSTKVLLDATENWNKTVREISLTKWRTAWERDHSIDDKFPTVFANYTNVP